MNAPVMGTHRQTGTTHQQINKIKEVIEMKLANLSTNLNTKVSQILNSKTPAKVLGGIALGALMMAATALPLGSVHADESSSLLVSGAASYEQMLEIEAGFSARHALVTGAPSYEQMLEIEAGFSARSVLATGAPSYEQMLEIEAGFSARSVLATGAPSYEQMLEIEAGIGNGKFRVMAVPSYEQMLEIEAGLDTGGSLALAVKTGSDEFSFESFINA